MLWAVCGLGWVCMFDSGDFYLDYLYAIKSVINILYVYYFDWRQMIVVISDKWLKF